MSETPALELRIRDNSAETVAALDRLASALGRVQSAVGNGMNLPNVASGISRLNSALSAQIPEENIARLERLAAVMERLQANANVNIGVNINNNGGAGGLDQVMANVRANVVNAMQPAESEVRTVAEGVEQATNGIGNDFRNAVETARESAAALVNDLVNGTSRIDLLRMRMNAMQEELRQGIESGRFNDQRIANYAMRIQDINRQIMDANEEAEHAAGGGFRNFFASLREGLRHVINFRSGLFGLFHSFVRIAKYRLMRTAIREIVDGFKTGIKNVREYSKAIGSDFYKAMDSANDATLKMKNSLGASLAPLLQMLIPILQRVISWVIEAANAINQFFAILRGQSSWTRAVDVDASSLEEVKESASGASKAINNLLADFDELNIIQSQSGGGGGSGAIKAPVDYESMFEEVYSFDEKIQGIAKKVRDIVNFVKDNFGTILTTALLIKGAILAWRLSAAFAETLPFLANIASGIALGATITLSVLLTNLTGKKFADTGNPAWLIGDALSGAVGAFLANKIATKLAGSAAGTITSGFTLIISGAVNLYNAKAAMDNYREGQSWALASLGSVEAGIGAGLATYGFGGTLAGSLAAGGWTAGIAFVITATVLLSAKNAATNRTMAYMAFKKKGENGISTEDYLKELQRRFTDLTSGATIVADVMLGFDDSKGNFTRTIRSLQSLNAFITSGKSLTEEQATQFKNAWEIVFTELDRMGTMSYETIFQGLKETIENGSKELRESANELKKTAIEIAGITGGARGKAKEEMSQILTEISSGDLSNVERYMELYKIWGGESAQDTIKNFMTGLSGISIKLDSENPVEEARRFLQQVQELSGPALEEFKKQYDSEIKALDEQREEINKAFESGYITQEQRDNALAGIDSLAALFKSRWDEQVKQIQDAVGGAYNQIAEQAVAGIYDSNLTDAARASYVKEVIEPLIKVFEDAGLEVPERLKKAYEDFGEFGVLGASGLANTENVKRYVKKFGQETALNELLASYFAESGYDNLAEVQDFGKMFTYMFSRQFGTEQDLMSLTDAQRKEFINGIISTFPEDIAAKALSYLMENYSQYGFTLGEILSNIDWGAVNALNGQEYTYGEDEYEYSVEDLVDAINEIIQEYNNGNHETEMPEIPYDLVLEIGQDGQDTNITGVSLPPIDDTQLSAALSQTVQDVSDKVASIRTSIQSLDGLSFSFTGGFLGGSFSVVMPEFAAEGGMFTAGQMFIAREAGPEMIGRMGNRSTVANNDQIVAGISSGVASGQEEQNALLRRQNDLLTQLLNKKIVAEAVPSSEWGAHNRKSNELYQRRTGVSV